jgi:hypothetical protein
MTFLPLMLSGLARRKRTPGGDSRGLGLCRGSGLSLCVHGGGGVSMIHRP